MKSSQPNTSEQPPPYQRLARSKNPASAVIPISPRIEVIADDGISYLLPYAQFLYAEELPTRPWKKNRRHRREISIHFACAT